MSGFCVNAQELPSFSELKEQLDESSLPLVNLTVDISTVNRNDYVTGAMEIVEYDKETGELTSQPFACKLKYRGATAATKNKKAFAIKLINDAGKSLDANIFGIREFDKWILDAMAVDRIRMRNRVCFDLWNELNKTPYDTDYGNRNGTEGQFVEVFINGNYNGIYCFTDKIDRKLLNLKKAKENKDGTVTVNGILYKGDSWDFGWNLLSYEEANTDTVVWGAYELQYPDDYPSINTWQPLMDLIDFCSSKTPAEDFHANYEDWFYVDNLADYLLFTTVLGIGDCCYKNTFLSTPNINDGHKWMITPWDLDMSFGGNYDGNYWDNTANFPRLNARAPYNRMYAQSYFKDVLKQKWTILGKDIFSEERVMGKINKYRDMFVQSGAWDREYIRWNGDPVPLTQDIDEELEYVSGWYDRNYAALSKQFGVPTAIETIHTDADTAASAPSDEYYYDLLGRKTLNPGKGFYIHKGKKIIIR